MIVITSKIIYTGNHRPLSPDYPERGRARAYQGRTVATLLPAKADAIALPMNKEIVLVQSSDLHVDEKHAAGSHHSDGRRACARCWLLPGCCADVVLLT